MAFGIAVVQPDGSAEVCPYRLLRSVTVLGVPYLDSHKRRNLTYDWAAGAFVQPVPQTDETRLPVEEL